MFRTRGSSHSGLLACVPLSQSRPGAIGLCMALFCLVSCATTSAFSQAPDTTQIDAYLKAITQADTTARLSALERFAAAAPPSNLRLDALVWIVWDEKQTHNDPAAATWAQQLLKADPDNPLGMTVALEHSPSPVQRSKNANRTEAADPLQ